MSVALFDLDNTLLCGDSDYQWGRFLIDQGLVDRAVYERENQRFFENYQAGTLDIYAFSRFAYKPLTQHSLDVLQNLRERYIEQKIQPIILPKARELLAWHRQQGDLPRDYYLHQSVRHGTHCRIIGREYVDRHGTRI